MQLFTLSHLFWLPSVFQGHKMYLFLSSDNFSSLYLIIPKDFSHPLVMLIVYLGLPVDKSWGSRVSASGRSVVILRNKWQLFLAWRKQVMFWICCVAPHSTQDAQWGGTGHWDEAEPVALVRPPGYGVNTTLRIHLWADFSHQQHHFISSN